MRVLGFIPARKGSKGVPNKNIKLIEGVPLLAYTVFTAQLAYNQGLLAEIFVSTDSRDYLRLLEPLGYSTNYLRPKKLAEDDSSTVEAIIDALDWLGNKGGGAFDAVMILQPTAPFRTATHIKNAIDLFKRNPEATCVAGIVRLGDTHPVRIKKLRNNIWLDDYCSHSIENEPSRRQDIQPTVFLRNGTIYLTTVFNIMNKKLIRGNRVVGMEMDEANSINIDNHLDFLTATAFLHYPEFKDKLSFFNDLRELYRL